MKSEALRVQNVLFQLSLASRQQGYTTSPHVVMLRVCDLSALRGRGGGQPGAPQPTAINK
jgi:hypothetical protein